MAAMYILEINGDDRKQWDDHMKEYTATVTERSQVTIPAEVRRLLGIKARDKVIFAIEDDQVRLLPTTFTLESAAGSVPSLGREVDPDVLVREAKEEKAERARRDR